MLETWKAKSALSVKKWFGKFSLCLCCMFVNHLVGRVLWGKQGAKRKIKIPASVGRCLFPWWHWACADVYDDLTHAYSPHMPPPRRPPPLSRWRQCDSLHTAHGVIMWCGHVVWSHDGGPGRRMCEEREKSTWWRQSPPPCVQGISRYDMFKVTVFKVLCFFV